MTNKKIFKYRVYCNTESKYITVWAQTEPNTCPNNISHVINEESNSILDEIKQDIVQIKEESVPTGGNFRIEGKQLLNIPGNSTTIQDISFNYPINSLRVFFRTSSSQINDILNVLVGPETVVGIVTQNVSIGSTTVNVSSGSLTYIQIGYEVVLIQGNVKNNIGEVISIDKVNNTITTTTSTINEFTTGANVSFQVRKIKNFIIGEPGICDIGTNKIGASYLPINTVVRIEYTNSSDSTKYFTYSIEYLY